MDLTYRRNEDNSVDYYADGIFFLTATDTATKDDIVPLLRECLRVDTQTALKMWDERSFEEKVSGPGIALVFEWLAWLFSPRTTSMVLALVAVMQIGSDKAVSFGIVALVFAVLALKGDV